MEIDWMREIRGIIDLGSESYERRVNRVALKMTGLAIFVGVVFWILFKRS